MDEPKTSSMRLPVREVARTSKPHRLELVRGPDSPREIELTEGTTVVGRSTTADLRIDSSELSRTHLSLTFVDGEYLIQDLNSSNGVYLNGVKIHSATLRDGDQIQVGGVILVYREGA